MLPVFVLLWCGAVLGASVDPSPSPPGDPPPARAARSGLVRDTAWWSAPEPEWRSRQQPSAQQAAANVQDNEWRARQQPEQPEWRSRQPPAAPEPEWRSRQPSKVASAPESDWRARQVPQDINLGTRSLRFVAAGVGDYQPAPSDLVRDYRFEPYYRQDLSAYDRTRDRDFFDAPRFGDAPRAAVPRRIVYFEDLGNRPKAQYYYQQQQQQQQQQPQASNYDAFGRFSNVRSPNIAISPYNRYNPLDSVRGVNSIVSEGTVENAPLMDDPYRSYNPRQPAPWSVQVGTSLTVKDDGRHAGRRFYVQSQREEPALARARSLNLAAPAVRPRSGGRLWAELQPRV